MLGDDLQRKIELVQLVKMFPYEIGLYSLSMADWTFIKQLFDVLKLFNELIKLVSLGWHMITTSTAISSSQSISRWLVPVKAYTQTTMS